jgi:phage-related protein
MNVEILDWNGYIQYQKNDVVRYGGSYYFALKKHMSFNPSVYNDDNYSDGNAIWATDKKLLWAPSYGIELDNQPSLKAYNAESPYFNIANDGINIHKEAIQISFNNMTNRECKAIITFLNIKEGYKSFLFDLPKPYNKTIKCICRSWSIAYQFFDNNGITAVFKEVIV